MLKRLGFYFKEMYPIVSRTAVSFLLFFEIYFLVILTHKNFEFNIGISEIVGSITIFGFLLFLRIADDFKDYKTDLKLFPQRPLPSGNVKKSDLITVLVIDLIVITVLNVLFMNNIYYFMFLMFYGLLMSIWFFSKAKIQKNLPLALVTHNPIQLIINMYVISFVSIKYNIELINYENILILFALYFDGLVWEIGRKIKAPKDETEYTTYSKLFGYKKPVLFILLIMLVDLVTSTLLVMELFNVAIIGTIAIYAWFVFRCKEFIKNPEKFSMKSLVEKHLFLTELYIVSLIVMYLIIKVF